MPRVASQLLPLHPPTVSCPSTASVANTSARRKVVSLTKQAELGLHPRGEAKRKTRAHMAAMELHRARGQNDGGGVKVKFIETQFVSSDAASFKSVVQRLTGKSAAMPSPGAAVAPVPLQRPRARAPCPTGAGGWPQQASHGVVPGSNNLMMKTAAARRDAQHAMPSAPSPRLEELHELCDFADLFYATAGARRDGGTNGFPY